MREDPHLHSGSHGQDATDPDEALPPELEALAQRLRVDGAAWQRSLPDPVNVVDRIHAIPLSALHTLDEERSPRSTQLTFVPEEGQRMQPIDSRPPRRGTARGILTVLAAVLIVGLLAGVLAQVAQRRGTSTGPAGHPTLTAPPTTATTVPAATPTPAPAATPTTAPTQTWTTIQAYTGSGNYTSPSFQVTSPWRVVWQCNRSMGNPGPYPVQVTAQSSAGPGDATTVLNTQCEAGNTRGTSAAVTSPAGLIYLSIHSAGDGEWDVRVQVLR